MFSTALLLLLSLFSSGTAYASTEADEHVYLDSSTLDQDSVLWVNFDLNSYNYKVRPIVSKGVVSIFSEEDNKWISGIGKWDELPRVHERMQIKVDKLAVPQSEIFFQLRDALTLEIRETQKLKFWGYKAYEDYLSRLNENLSSFGDSQELEVPDEVADVAESSASYPKSLLISQYSPERKSVFIPWGLFITAAIVGFLKSKPLK